MGIKSGMSTVFIDPDVRLKGRLDEVLKVPNSVATLIEVNTSRVCEMFVTFTAMTVDVPE